jgi:hypothetical protein
MYLIDGFFYSHKKPVSETQTHREWGLSWPLGIDAEPLSVVSASLGIDAEPFSVVSAPLGMDAEPLSVVFAPLGIDAEPFSVVSAPLGIDAQSLGMYPQPLDVDAEPLGMYPQPLGVDAQSLGLYPQPLGVDPAPEHAYGLLTPLREAFSAPLNVTSRRMGYGGRANSSSTFTRRVARKDCTHAASDAPAPSHGAHSNASRFHSPSLRRTFTRGGKSSRPSLPTGRAWGRCHERHCHDKLGLLEHLLIGSEQRVEVASAIIREKIASV